MMMILCRTAITFLFWARADDFTIDERARFWQENLKQTVKDYYNRAWYQRKNAETTAEMHNKQKIEPLIANGNFFGADYNPNKTKNASYIDLSRIFPSLS